MCLTKTKVNRKQEPTTADPGNKQLSYCLRQGRGAGGLASKTLTAELEFQMSFVFQKYSTLNYCLTNIRNVQHWKSKPYYFKQQKQMYIYIANGTPPHINYVSDSNIPMNSSLILKEFFSLKYKSISFLIIWLSVGKEQ